MNETNPFWTFFFQWRWRDATTIYSLLTLVLESVSEREDLTLFFKATYCRFIPPLGLALSTTDSCLQLLVKTIISLMRPEWWNASELRRDIKPRSLSDHLMWESDLKIVNEPLHSTARGPVSESILHITRITTKSNPDSVQKSSLC